MQTVANEAGHGDAAVLDLGVAQPADGRLLADAPVARDVHADDERLVREAQRVVEARRAGQRVLQIDEVLLRLLHGHGGGLRRGGDEGVGGAEREGDDELLHGVYGLVLLQ